MKGKWRFLLAAGVLAALLSGAALAADYTHCADALHDMGLFRGTGSGYALDQGADRAQAATMFVRLLGKETEALATDYKSPFTDVPAWAEPYVSYLYQKGLTKGTSATTYSSNVACSADMYCTFMLRDLGYAEGSDFTYDKGAAYAATLGIVDSYVTASPFLRDNLAAVSYCMLAASPKNQPDTDLLSQLVAAGAVSAAGAEDTLATFAAYRAYMEQARGMEALTGVKMQTDSKTVTAYNDVSVTTSWEETTALSYPGGDLQNLVMQTDAANLGTGDSYTMYYKDGWIYLNSSSGDYKYEMNLSEYANKAESMGMMNNALYAILSVTREQTAEGTQYTFQMAPNVLNSYVMGLMDDLGDVSDLNIHFLVFSCLMGADGMPKQCSTEYEMRFATKIDGISTQLTLSSVANARFLAFNDDVKVTLPADADSYTDVGA